MDAAFPARAAGSLLQLSHESGAGEVASAFYPFSKPAMIASLSAEMCWSDILAFATAICSFFICRTLLLPILLPEKDALARENDSDNFCEEDDDEASQMNHEPEDTSELNEETRQSQGQPCKEATTRPCSRTEDEPLVIDEKKDSFGCTQLHLAAQTGDATKVAELLDQGFSIHAREDCGDTSLHLAVRAGCVETTQTLLAHGASPHVRNIFGNTPLSIAASLGDKTMYDLLQAGAAQA
eukprot:TRINITY_DN9386_c0_g1_i1.p1 TRINITY_DN9386_c0_g1~~TRINITY_DN9386_c0_g1_i1.p1  ORF type:complete len:239 (+),score=47.29 TRINITY_DN9386_c0_g1_i1:36-752(+)